MTWVRWSTWQIAEETGHPISRVLYALRRGYVLADDGSVLTTKIVVKERDRVRGSIRVRRYLLSPSEMRRLKATLAKVEENSKKHLRDRVKPEREPIGS